jgi:hypothetical protein
MVKKKNEKEKKSRFDISMKISRNSKAEEELENTEQKIFFNYVSPNPKSSKRFGEKGININLGGVLGAIFSKKNIGKGVKKVLSTTDKMLKEDIKDYSEFGSKEKRGVKVEHGFRMRFLDEEEKNKSKKEKRG